MATKMRVTTGGDNLNVRANTSDRPVIGKLPNNSIVDVESVSGDWATLDLITGGIDAGSALASIDYLEPLDAPTSFKFESYPVPDAPRVVTQPWGANPQYYAQFGLPGHEGLDLRAPNGTRIAAVAPGTVRAVYVDPNVAYGINVRIDHADSYQTIYAHLQSASVAAGSKVTAGQVVGLADNTGNSSGSHLHMTLKRVGYTYTDKYGTWPSNIHDPTPFITPLLNPAGVTVIGTHPALPALDFNHRLGVHTLERIEEAREAFDLGCRSFTMLNNVTGAREMRSKGAAVIYRRFVDHGVVPDPSGFAHGIGLGAEDTLMAMGLNEADNLSTSDLVARFNWDRPWAMTMHQLYPSCFILIGSFSMGTPEIENTSVAQVWRDTYGNFLNANASWCGLNYHTYHRRHDASVPPFNHEIQPGVYWPSRFAVWGYDPNFGGLNKNVVLAGDESGVDIGGIGGYEPCGYNDNYFLNWWKLRQAEFQPHPQIYVQNLFQLSPNQRWAGYNLRVVLGGMTKVWTNQV